METRTPPKWDCGPDADEHAGDVGEARQQRAENEYARTGGWLDRLPYTSAEYHRIEGGRYDEW